MATRLLARRRSDLTSGEFEQPFSDLLVRYTFARVELGFGFGNRACLGFAVDLIKNGLHLSHATLGPLNLRMLAYLGLKG